MRASGFWTAPDCSALPAHAAAVAAELRSAEGGCSAGPGPAVPGPKALALRLHCTQRTEAAAAAAAAVASSAQVESSV